MSAGLFRSIFMSVAIIFSFDAVADDAQCVENTRKYASEICAALKAHDLPLELSMLPVSESCGKPDAVSKKGAAGIWQLMPFIARKYGINSDERHDVGKSSRAAAQYLKSLYSRFGDIYWTVAAYNAGGNNLKRATGFRRGLGIEAARVMPEAYALAKAVGWLIRKHGNICE